jgi:hypothetical protein
MRGRFRRTSARRVSLSFHIIDSVHDSLYGLFCTQIHLRDAHTTQWGILEPAPFRASSVATASTSPRSSTWPSIARCPKATKPLHHAPYVQSLPVVYASTNPRLKVTNVSHVRFLVPPSQVARAFKTTNRPVRARTMSTTTRIVACSSQLKTGPCCLRQNQRRHWLVWRSSGPAFREH